MLNFSFYKGKYSVNPLYPALERFTFFRVSRLTHRRPERQCNPARYPKPRKKANRSCGRARMATVHWQGIFL
ncbi:MAG: hypothetical protein C4B57_09865 [Deltaproteobacteria bacterium]|nr:MAG: hypothetical protein C4B57_09865 [Deltaproteobacteria bacterium]